MDTYPTIYTDKYGVEHTTITNDGTLLRILLRGVPFEGTDFDSLEATVAADDPRLSQFSLNKNELCSCHIDCQIPILIVQPHGESDGTLLVHLELGNPTPRGGLDKEILQINLQYQDRCIASAGKSGWFEDELGDIQHQLPDNVYMKACITCLFSDYSPAGHGLFGCMMCFRNIKDEYVKVHSKQDFWRVHTRRERAVQEIFLCPEFQRRIPGIGYRSEL
jgi:hypothetical protein